MKGSNETFFTKAKSFFSDRRASNSTTPPTGMPCRRGKNKARFGGANAWYLSTSIEVKEVDVDATQTNSDSQH